MAQYVSYRFANRMVKFPAHARLASTISDVFRHGDDIRCVTLAPNQRQISALASPFASPSVEQPGWLAILPASPPSLRYVLRPIVLHSLQSTCWLAYYSAVVGEAARWKTSRVLQTLRSVREESTARRRMINIWEEEVKDGKFCYEL